MAINFIPNDPMAASPAPTMRVETERLEPPDGRAGFNYFNRAPVGLYNPGSPEFLFWQCRQAALMALEVCELFTGPMTQWQSRQKLDLLQDAGIDLNAYYDRASLSFFHKTTNEKTTFSGASTDVVAHEAGHALLDAIRPDLWNSSFTEVGAFHEAFGDCIAILTALSDRGSRQAVLDTIDNPNFKETTAEDLSDGVRQAIGPNHPAATPRRALNTFQWQLPSTLPPGGRDVGEILTSEIHSFGRIFSGCFYDTIRNIFNSLPNRSEANLWIAAQTAARLLIASIRQVRETQRFFQEIGRGMVLVDRNQNGGVNQQAIAQAFANHGIALGSSALTAPTASLAGPAPQLTTPERILAEETKRDLLKHIGAPEDAEIRLRTVNLFGTPTAEAVYYLEVPLGEIDRRLENVVAVAAESTYVGSSGARSAIISTLPEPNTTEDEVRSFVESLIANDDIEFQQPASAVAATQPMTSQPTHRIVEQDGKQVLTRIRFACRHKH